MCQKCKGWKTNVNQNFRSLLPLNCSTIWFLIFWLPRSGQKSWRTCILVLKMMEFLLNLKNYEIKVQFQPKAETFMPLPANLKSSPKNSYTIQKTTKINLYWLWHNSIVVLFVTRNYAIVIYWWFTVKRSILLPLRIPLLRFAVFLNYNKS